MKALVRTSLSFLLLLPLLHPLLFSAPAQAAAPSRPPQQAAQTETTVENLPFELTVPVSCALGGAGEDVALTGTVHAVTHYTARADGSSVYTTHGAAQGIRGVGLTSGDTYRLAGATNYADTFSGLPHAQTYVSVLHLVGPGPGNNITLYEVTHYTYDANGDLTVSFDKSRAECS